MYSYFIAWSVAHVMTHAHIRTMFNDQVRALIVFKRILHCNTRIFCSRKAKLFLATFYWCNAVPIILFRLLIIYTNTSDFLLPFVWLFVGIAFVHNFRQSTSHLCPFVIYPVNKYLSKCFEPMCACFFASYYCYGFIERTMFAQCLFYLQLFCCVLRLLCCVSNENHNYSDSYPEFKLRFKCFWLFYIILFCFISFLKDFCSYSIFRCMCNKRIPIFFYFTFLFNDNYDQVKNDLKDFCPLLTTFETTKLSLLKICMFQFIICMLKM